MSREISFIYIELKEEHGNNNFTKSSFHIRNCNFPLYMDIELVRDKVYRVKSKAVVI